MPGTTTVQRAGQQALFCQAAATTPNNLSPNEHATCNKPLTSEQQLNNKQQTAKSNALKLTHTAFHQHCTTFSRTPHCFA